MLVKPEFAFGGDFSRKNRYHKYMFFKAKKKKPLEIIPAAN
jgi:hypothetical protein